MKQPTKTITTTQDSYWKERLADACQGRDATRPTGLIANSVEIGNITLSTTQSGTFILSRKDYDGNETITISKTDLECELDSIMDCYA